MTESSAHLTDETVAAYLEGVVAPGERASVEAHLGDCEYCRARLALADRALETAPRRRAQITWRPIAAAALAASLGGVLLLSRSAAPDPPSEMRGPAQELARPAVHVVRPQPGATVEAKALQFIWSSQEPDVLYQVTLSAADGRMLWTTRTADTAAAPPPDVRERMQPGKSYFWRVDALLTNLRSVTSSDQRFQVASP